MTRRFSKSDRVALYLAADGKCSECGCQLEAGWHADHETPFSKGGLTDVVNGRALCPACNLKKGARGMADGQLREWQQEALNAYRKDNKRDWLLSATPAAGKTLFALTLASELLTQRVVERVAVVVPTDPLKGQWAAKAAEVGLDLDLPDNADGGSEKAGYVGAVVTYPQVASQSDLQRRATRRKTLVIFDEIHHAGDDKKWGTALSNAFERATKRLLLTGTPWRQGNSLIPFVSYNESGVLVSDFAYEYGDAVRNDVCRAIAFHAYDGEARWQDCGKVIQAPVSGDLDERDLSPAMSALLSPWNNWIPSLLRRAVDSLNELRAEVPNAGGLVVADDQPSAEAYTEILEKIDNRPPVLVISKDPEAKMKLDAFDASAAKWLVAVRMVSEGIDIPRLAVGVYANRIRTPLFFRQVVGRFVRKSLADYTATLFIPAVPALMRHAKEIEDELRHVRELEAEQFEKAEQQLQNEQMFLETRTPLSSSEAELAKVISDGFDYGRAVMEAGRAFCEDNGIPVTYELKAAQGLQKLREQEGQTVSVVPMPKSSTEPKFRYEKRLRDDIKILVGKLARRDDIEHKVINTEIIKRFGVQRKEATIEELEAILSYLGERLSG